ncbi:MAG: hypothetical protein ACRELY_32390 [Polyangiaceae bacterium]
MIGSRRVLLKLAPLLFSAPFTLLFGCSKRVSPAECETMLDRYLDLSMAPPQELSHLPPKQAESVVSEQKADRRANPSYATTRARCEREVTRAEFDCAMHAPTANDWEACLD